MARRVVARPVTSVDPRQIEFAKPQADGVLHSLQHPESGIQNSPHSHRNASTGFIRAARIAGTSAPNTDDAIAMTTIQKTSCGFIVFGILSNAYTSGFHI